MLSLHILTDACIQGKLLYIVSAWTFLLFLAAADRELLRNSVSEVANTDYDCSRHDPACVVNV